jgi:5-methylcytosine-specific restriction endonuclease McrA
MPVKPIGQVRELAEPVGLREGFDSIGRCPACGTGFAWNAPVGSGAICCLACGTGSALKPTNRRLVAGFVHLANDQLADAIQTRNTRIEADDLAAAVRLARREERLGHSDELDAFTESERLTTANLTAHRGERCNRCQLEISWRRRQPQRPIACPLCGHKMIAEEAKLGTRVLSAKAANRLARAHAVERERKQRAAQARRRTADAKYRDRHRETLKARHHARSDFSDHGPEDALGAGTSTHWDREGYYLALLADPCTYCGLHRPGVMTRDHIVPRSGGGDDGWENAAGICSWCNSAKTNQPLLLWLLHRGVAELEDEVLGESAPSLQPKYWTAIAVPEGTLYAQYRAAKFGRPDWGAQMIAPERWYVSLSTPEGHRGAAGQRPVGSTALLELGFDAERAAALEEELVTRIWPDDEGDHGPAVALDEISEPWPPPDPCRPRLVGLGRRDDAQTVGNDGEGMAGPPLR